LSRIEHSERWPEPEAYADLASCVPCSSRVEQPRFVRQDRQALGRIGGYEQHVAKLRAVPTRAESWHDFFNMVVWAHFPELRWALNALHVDPGETARDERNGRTPSQNLATSFDETGMLVVSESRAILEGLRAVQLKRIFWEQRAQLAATTRFFIVGHGLLESLLCPHPRLVARSLLMHVPDALSGTADELRQRSDARAAARIHEWRARRTVLDPIPLAAIPGFADNDDADFYDDRSRLPFEPRSRLREASSDFCT
jgi:hypothetical protein